MESRIQKAAATSAMGIQYITTGIGKQKRIHIAVKNGPKEKREICMTMFSPSARLMIRPRSNVQGTVRSSTKSCV